MTDERSGSIFHFSFFSQRKRDLIEYSLTYHLFISYTSYPEAMAQFIV